jgi:hypothetical protein
MSALSYTLMRGDYFVTSGEVLIPSCHSRSGDKRMIEATSSGWFR